MLSSPQVLARPSSARPDLKKNRAATTSRRVAAGSSRVVAALSMAAAVMAIHTYYGFTADGGPAGVGEAVGRAVRTSVTATVFVLLTITLSVYGQSGNFHLSG